MLHEVVDSADPKLLEILYSVASDFNNPENDLNSDQLDELKRRLALYDSGEMKFSSWYQMISRIESK
ncbi:addiction module protein [Algoriphagus antarcticus]|uniref:Putative addiction module component n=1 Tax=Algoriphagus antarcticus TaxID=238540 RepID=A0A3E0DR23_9BACT|nr:addiction module protein [Algoriphagus antarcticus]REG84792.1 putative addiction module component [Algoriphagus antarcticus]